MEAHDDIRIDDRLNEERSVLKYKVIWGMLQGLEKLDFHYLIKTDDDVFVDLPLLIRYMIPRNRTNIYTGRCANGYGGSYGSPKIYGYCSGGGYILSQDVVQGMMLVNHKVSPWIPSLRPNIIF